MQIRVGQFLCDRQGLGQGRLDLKQRPPGVQKRCPERKIEEKVVSTAAMDDLERGRNTSAAQREAQFLRLREQIEAQAAVKIRKLEFEGMPRGIVLRSIDFRDKN